MRDYLDSLIRSLRTPAGRASARPPRRRRIRGRRTTFVPLPHDAVGLRGADDFWRESVAGTAS